MRPFKSIFSIIMIFAMVGACTSKDELTKPTVVEFEFTMNVESEEGDPDLNRVHSRRDARQMFSRFSSAQVSCERPPQKTLRRKGVLAGLYNNGFVPTYRALPSSLTKRFGWHLIIKAIK